MATTTNLNELVINTLTKSQFDSATKDPNQLYLITDEDDSINITGAASTIVDSNLTASRALVSNSSGKVAVSAVTSTELGYLDGVTSNIQTQLDGKASSSDINTALNRTNAVNAANTSYTTYMARGESLNSSETNPTANGTIAWTYE